MPCTQHLGAPVRGRSFRPSFVPHHRSLRLQPVLTASSVVEPLTYVAFDQLAQHAAATVTAAVGPTPLGRGLVAQRDVAPRDPVVSVPVHNSLVLADDPLSGISIFTDRHHRRWQEVHGNLPEQLLEFLQGETRWDIRMAAWLLYLKQHPGPLWASYMQHLPREQDMCCLLNYSRDEIHELQIPALQAEAMKQADWSSYLHAEFLHSRSGRLASLQLSDSLPLSLWAISMVRSRTFSEDVNGETLTLMVPYADLANHSFNNNCTFCLSRDNKNFQLQALHPLTAGEEISISYGAIKPNHELLRDYGFFIPGNPCDRVRFIGIAGLSSTGSSDDSSAESSRSSLDGMDGVPRLNPVTLMEAVGFTGDLAAAQRDPAVDIQPRVPPAPNEVPRLARRKAALLSMPLDTPPAAASGRGSSSGNGSASNGFASWWFGESMQAWTPSGEPTPQPLSRHKVPAERSAIAVLQQQLVHQLACLSTSTATDEELLQLHREAIRHSSACSSVMGDRSSSLGESVRLPIKAKASSDWRVQPDFVQLQQRRGSAAPAEAVPTVRSVLLTPRMETAIGARLEHKLLLKEAITVLMLYDKYLAGHT